MISLPIWQVAVMSALSAMMLLIRGIFGFKYFFAATCNFNG